MDRAGSSEAARSRDVTDRHRVDRTARTALRSSNILPAADPSMWSSSPGTGVPSKAGTTGMSIAADNPSGNDRLGGLIDQLRLINVARTAAQICADAGNPSCP